MDTTSYKKEYPKEVLEIHNAFQIACELLQTKAIDKFQNPDYYAATKAKRLQSIGATKAKGANLNNDIKNIREGELSNELVELILSYQIKYPNYKFITEDQVKNICLKYSLICGRIDSYTGFIPEKNLKAIEFFNSVIKEEDIGKDIWSVGRGLIHEMGMYRDNKNEEYDDSGRRARGEFYKNPSHVNMRHKHEYTIGYKKAKLKICAPITDMDMEDMELEDGYKMEEIKPILIPDPVILQPVNAGYLIVTVWGDEASDENVVNHKHN